MAGFTKKRGIYTATVRMPNGDQKSISLKTKNKKVAKPRKKRIENFEYEMKSGIITEGEFLAKIGRKKEEESSNSLKSLIDKFLEFKSNTVTESTIKTYKETFPHLIDEWGGNLSLDDLSIEHYTEFVKRLKTETVYNEKEMQYETRWNKTSINIKLGCLKCFLNWLVDNRVIDYYPFTVRKLKIPKEKHKFLTRNQFDKLINNTDGQFYKDVFTFYVNTGLRLGELNNAKLEGDFLIVDSNTSKTRSERYLEMPQELIDLYKKIIVRKYSKDAYTKNFTKARRKAGLSDDITFHSLRHTYAYRSWLKFGDIMKTKKALGHAGVQTTEIYADIPDKYLKQELGSWDKDSEKSAVCLKMAFIELP